MNDIFGKLEQVELKVRQLALKLERIEKENGSLLKENQLLKKALKKEEAKHHQLEQQLQHTHTTIEAKREDVPESTKKIRKELDRYIQEIDKCIEWLSEDIAATKSPKTT